MAGGDSCFPPQLSQNQYKETRPSPKSSGPSPAFHDFFPFTAFVAVKLRASTHALSGAANALFGETSRFSQEQQNSACRTPPGAPPLHLKVARHETMSLNIASSSLSAAPVAFTYPPASLFRFPPDPVPRTLAPPPGDGTLAHPFTIPAGLYNDLLSVNVPITIALVYATSVTILNQVNAKRGYKPWAFSKTSLFRTLVILHNVFLAAYSAWTFVGMVNAIRLSWPGWRGDEGYAGAVDALCKINGPRGLGSAITYNSTDKLWTSTSRTVKLLGDGVPDPSDVGRIWNSGLAFYGWFFYLSKFYEVLDTAIILAKGKKSSILQTYHHAGAMLSMWAGIRYMAPPIWMFVLVNSGIHALMYTYYALTALYVRVPFAVKRTLTTLQIAQFVVGVTFAFAHLFVAYRKPTSVPYIFSLADNLSSAVSSSASSVVSVATATASAGVPSWLKKLALRAAGSEGVAENVRNEQGETFGIDARHAVEDLKAREETRYRTDWTKVHCTDTSGQTFAILLNCIYLAPLTWLFVRFFLRSYSRRSQMEQGKTGQPRLLEKSAGDALKGIGRELSDAMGDMHGSEPTISAEEASEEQRPGGPNARNSSGNARNSSGKEEKAKDETQQTSRDQSDKQNNEAKKTGEGNSDKKKNRRKERGEGSGGKGEDEQAVGDDKEEEKKPLGDARAYEASPEDLMDKADKQAEQDLNGGRAGGKKQAKRNDGERKKAPGDASAYEANLEEVMDEADKKAEKDIRS